MALPSDYEIVVGLEVHAQLATRSKIFCGDEVAFACRPNTRVSPVSLGHPGALPQLNKACVELAIKMGLATGCTIAERCHFARKNYFYPDLPKGYQISQDTTPICRSGWLTVRYTDRTTGELTTKTIGITRIHIEEDAGKSLHDQDPFDTLIDLNRASVGLIEIVSEPDMRSPEEAMAYLTEVRKLVRYLDICDGNMEEGSLRCDANVSVRKRGTSQLGTRAEVKNLNSISNVGRAIAYEAQRQAELLEAGGTVARETRSFDAATGKTTAMRDKESADDYRYFPEPDLQPLAITPAQLEALRAEMPELPEVIYRRFTETYRLPDFDATLLTESKEMVAFYRSVVEGETGNVLDYKTAANWVLGPVRTYLNDQAIGIEAFPLAGATLHQIARLVEGGQVSFSVAKERLFPLALAHEQANGPGSADAEAIAQTENLVLDTDTDALAAEIGALLAANPDKVATYLGGKTGLLGFFVGQLMKSTGGKADPKTINTLVAEALEAQRG